jgi:methyl-accepting chemotaxis protein
MKLGTKIILGFIVTNIIYFVLLTTIFLLVKPQQTRTEILTDYILPVVNGANSFSHLVTEQRSTIRAYQASPTKDPKIFDLFLAQNREAIATVETVDNLLLAPEAESLKTPELQVLDQAINDLFEKFTEMSQAVQGRQDGIMKARGEAIAAFDDVTQKIKDALKLESDAFDREVGSGAVETIKSRVRRIEDLNAAFDSVNRSFQSFVRSLLRGDQELFNLSLTQMAESEQQVIKLAASSQVPAIKAGLEKVRKALLEGYEPSLKATMSLIQADAELMVAHETVCQKLVDTVKAHLSYFNDAANNYARGMITAVDELVFAMLAGAVLALVVSLISAVFITRGIINNIDTIVASLSKSSHETELSASRMTESSHVLASGATENAASLEETSAALEELSSMTKRNSDNASEAKALTGQAAEVVGQAEGSMAKVIQAMEEISRSGNEIGKIIKTIDEIAFQTNLLALNAAVEAARAGEAGAGFAVVADEVRNLAIRSADAAKNTAELIAATINNINSGSEMVNVTSEAFKAASAIAGNVGTLVAEVAEASKEQSQGIDQITKAMAEMDKVTQSNAAAAEESAGEATRLARQAKHLLNAVNDVVVLVHGVGASEEAFSENQKQLKLRFKAPASQQRAANKALPMGDNFDD